MAKTPVEIICVLDRSGSMSSLTDEVIGSFNNFLKEQQKIDGPANLTLVLFDDKHEIVYDKVPLKEVKPIDHSIYYTRGMTALYDAIGKSIMNINQRKKKAICLIQTDGMNNASQEYTIDMIKELVEKKTKLGWDFQFLGANIDAFDVGNNLGFAAHNTFQFNANARGISDSYAYINTSTTNYRINN